MALPQKYIENAEKEVYTEDEYFEFERRAFGHWEFARRPPGSDGRRLGDIRAMSGGKDDHNAIASNIVATLHAALLPRGCRVYGSDMKVHAGDGLNTFPDVSVVCGERQYYLGRPEIIMNPLLIVEVLSNSTQGYDRGEKFDHYQTLPTLTDYLLVAQDEPRVWLYTRQDDHWELRSV